MSGTETSSRVDSSIDIEEEEPDTCEKGGGSCLKTLRKLNTKLLTRIVLKVVAVALYNIYIVYAIHFHRVNGKDLDWCGGLGFLIVITLSVYLALFYFYILKPWTKKSRIKVKVPKKLKLFARGPIFLVIVYVCVIATLITFLVLDTAQDRYRELLF